MAVVVVGALCCTTIGAHDWRIGAHSGSAPAVAEESDDGVSGAISDISLAAEVSSQSGGLVQKFVTTVPLGSAVEASPAPETDSDDKTVVQICPEPENDTDYDADTYVTYTDVATEDKCRNVCTETLECDAWSWGASEWERDIHHMCWLKRLSSGMDRKKRTGIVSGFPCRRSHVRKPRTVFPDEFPEHSILCFALMQAEGYETDLIKLQFAQGVGIFKCDEYTIYSSQVFEVVDGVSTHKVNSDLKCEYGGEFMTALNTPIFFAVWEAIWGDGRFKLHEWTVKADPDCVFFPSRLRVLLEAYPPPEGGIYINNCKFGLHGPLEIFSTKAMEVLAEGKQECSDHFWELCSGDCYWGEDMFVDQCYQRVFKDVVRASDWSILVEDHCDPPKGWESCEDRSKVAFHPYKTQESWMGCLRGAGALEELVDV